MQLGKLDLAHGASSKKLRAQLSAMLRVAEECEDEVAAVDCQEHDELRWQIRWCDTISKSSCASKKEKKIFSVRLGNYSALKAIILILNRC